jgi:TPR repeat protein
MHYFGVGGLTKDDAEAVRYWNLSANKGEPAAWNQLGIGCMNGSGGLTQSEEEALRCFREATRREHHLGSFNLGRYYYSGRCGLARDDAQAVYLWRESIRMEPIYLSKWSNWMRSIGLEDVLGILYRVSEQGSAPVFLALSYMYLNGLGGLPKNEEEAIRLLEQAAQRGNSSATQQLDQLKSSRSLKRVAGEVVGAGGLSPVFHRQVTRVRTTFPPAPCCYQELVEGSSGAVAVNLQSDITSVPLPSAVRAASG